MKFDSEKDLVESFINFMLEDVVLNHIQSIDYCSIEPFELFGIPDIVVASIKSYHDSEFVVETVAFEMKLSKWKRALMQAFRYRSFAQIVYVVMDSKYVNPAIKNIDSFHKSKIGLISLSPDGSFTCHYSPVSTKPYASHLEKLCNEKIISSLEQDHIQYPHAIHHS